MEKNNLRRKNIVKVSQKIEEGKRSRVVSFIGEIIKSRGYGENRMITVRQTIDGVSVDRILPTEHPSIVNIEIVEAKRRSPVK